MNQLFRAVAICAVVWTGISAFKKIVTTFEEEDLARLGAGESDFERHHTLDKKHHLQEVH